MKKITFTDSVGRIVEIELSPASPARLRAMGRQVVRMSGEDWDEADRLARQQWRAEMGQ